MYKLMAVLSMVLVLSGCANMSPAEKKTMYIVGGILVIGAIAASGSSGSADDSCNDYITYPNDSGIYIPRC